MNGQGVGQILFFVGALIALAYPLGLWMNRVYGTFRAPGPLRALEGGFYRVVRTQPRAEQSWQSYARTVLVFSVAFTALLYGMQRLQATLFLNPDGMKAVPPHLALNTAVSFVTNTS
jgi:K+-transporting ATPase ATPase A chain